MPEIEPIDAQFRKIKRRFDDDPKDWRVLSDIDARGNKDMFINQREDLWQIKTKPLSPITGIARSCHVRNLDDDTTDPVKILAFGHYGTGKTYFLVGLLRLGMKCLVISTDMGGSGLTAIPFLMTVFG